MESISGGCTEGICFQGLGKMFPQRNILAKYVIIRFKSIRQRDLDVYLYVPNVKSDITSSVNMIIVFVIEVA